jgi:hypothetical protein
VYASLFVHNLPSIGLCGISKYLPELDAMVSEDPGHRGRKRRILYPFSNHWHVTRPPLVLRQLLLVVIQPSLLFAARFFEKFECFMIYP